LCRAFHVPALCELCAVWMRQDRLNFQAVFERSRSWTGGQRA
jgi:hypothetical protein